MMPDTWERYTIGEGIATAMQEAQDAPATDESVLVAGGQANFALGLSGVLYVWMAETNTVHRYAPFTPGGYAPVVDTALPSREHIIQVASMRAGIPYRLDPPPDSVNNIDCSLYVLVTLRDAGIPLQGVRTAEQIRQACVPIPWADVRMGDLLFFENTYQVQEPVAADGHVASHIGISMGAGTQKMWDAHGSGVQFTDISGDYWQSVLFEARRVPQLMTTPSSTGGRPILNTDRQDIRHMLQAAAETAGIPLEFALTCAIAESGLNPRAERYGAWPDISFGYGQQIVLYHYLGDRSSTPANIAAVRDSVFADPQGNLNDMCIRLASCLQRVQGVDLSPVNGDPLIGALVVYNAGSWKPAGDPWWNAWAGNVRNYQAAQVKARGMLT
jgi:cell wall-associated NlpC family hydrolase